VSVNLPLTNPIHRPGDLFPSQRWFLCTPHTVLSDVSLALHTKMMAGNDQGAATCSKS
jgi:hypothetical protein